jgi:hypothetical protein
MTTLPQKKFRPLGLSIAILSAAVLYGIVPLLPLILVAIVATSGHDLSADVLTSTVWIDTTLAILTLITALLAWLGRPYQSRWFLLIIVWLSTGFHLLQLAKPAPAPGTTSAEIGGTLSGLSQSATYCLIPFLVLVPLYITWYLNRAPARAFYQPQTLDSRRGTQ